MRREKRNGLRLLAVLLAMCMLVSVMPMMAARTSASPEITEEPAKHTQKILVLEFDPYLETKNQGLNEWLENGRFAGDAEGIIDDLKEDIEYSSGGLVDVQIVDKITEREFPRHKGEFTLVNKTKAHALDEETALDIFKNGWSGYWENSHSKSTQDFDFDYAYYIEKYNLIERRNRGEFDQVWMPATPPLNAYETCMVGKNAYWINGAGLNYDCDPFAIVGMEIERRDCPMEGLGHMMEDLLKERFSYSGEELGYAEGAFDGVDPSTLNLWERFTLNNYNYDGLANVGNVHYAPNAKRNDDRGEEENTVESNWRDWKENYPNFKGISEPTNKLTWDFGTDASTRNYQRFWFSCMPHVGGVTADGYSNSWWDYYCDFDFVTGVEAPDDQKLTVGETASPVFTISHVTEKTENVKANDSKVSTILDGDSISIAKDGTITAVKAGDTTVTMYSEGKSDSFIVSVEEMPYQISFDANGGTGAPESQTKTQGQALTLSTTKPTREGYTFQGWATTADATTAQYQPGGSYTQDNDVTLYAVWKEDTHTVTYDANGGTGAPESQTKTQGQALTLSTAKPTREGYTFQGWATTADATTAQYQPGGSYTQNEDVTLYAVWKEDTYTVTYDANGGIGAPESQAKTQGQALILSTAKPTREGYTFQGWATTADATTAQYQPGGSYTQNEDVTLYAIWKEDTGVTTLQLNQGVDGSVSDGSYTWYQFTAPTDGTYVFSTTGSTDTIGGLYLSRTGSRTKYDDDSGNGLNFQMSYTIFAKQTVYLKVRGFSTRTSGSYTVSVTQEVTSLQLDKGVNGSISKGSSTWYQFTAPTDGTYVFSTTGSTDTYGELYESMTGASVKRNDDGWNGFNFRISHAMTANQTVYLKVRGFSTYTSGSYTVSVTKETAKALQLDEDLDGSVSDGSHTWYEFTAPDDGTYTFSTTGSTDTYGELYQSMTDSYTKRDDDSGNGLNFKISYSMKENQTIYLEVRGYSARTSGSYTVSVTKETAKALRLDEGLDGSISKGSCTWYEFTAPTDGTYTFSTTGSTDTYGELYQSMTDAFTKRDDDSGNGFNFRVSYPMKANQTIYLKVRGFSVYNSGSYTVSVTR